MNLTAEEFIAKFRGSPIAILIS
ncbi:MAG: hypothetical protein EWV55_03105 [Microcystis viridis Mv_BB_P_19951000_S69]|uniref:Uncharacterized protein n=1 Tax=Microcystis viridis Mv_BB_P_19951000_S68D TaxID=2486270 RepID=A0A552I195_MICVR|nr:MAG: hypothetical protein EWV47_10080 [Microcystis viridis Mv_BB_P_19951000_S68]TRU77255.1 MAG: hypothetical protein EWV77_05970 [Microcystis viridis Mv_BB_P_19951000_S68D]TRU78296.1 MAG: hypothetical protein EWV55_03105 [Microcystis viridis Mv_BB_P_19951000_S69]TRU79869.1 MAG: hypothetical protein EWV46_24730 [Microcystis viridis Mv_BB_P_19951000_S69D]